MSCAPIAAGTALPVVVGSGVTQDNVGDILAVADGVIVASALKRDGVWWNPVDPERLAAFAAGGCSRPGLTAGSPHPSSTSRSISSVPASEVPRLRRRRPSTTRICDLEIGVGLRHRPEHEEQVPRLQPAPSGRARSSLR